jgi:hypothetical protein
MLVGHWPLIGNFNDYSGNNNNLTYQNNNNKIIIEPAGKIGVAYKRAVARDGADWLESNNNVNFQGDFTFAIWAYVSAVHSGTANGLLTNHNHNNNTGAGITVREISSSDYRISCNTGTGSSRTFNTFFGTTNIKDKWSHLVLRFIKETNTFSLWTNGNKELEWNYAQFNVSQRIGLFSWSLGYNNSSDYRPAAIMNDARVYDHALSEYEVKELAKAKILHYSFDDPSEEPTINLVGNPNLIEGNHITQFSAGASYGIYSIETLSNPGISPFVIRQRTGEYEMIFTADLIAGATYTMSCWVAYTLDWNGNNLIFHSRFFGTPANTSIGGAPDGILETKVIGGLTWTRVYASITSPVTTVTSFSWYLGYSGSEATVGFRYFTQLQLERKPYATPFVDGTRNIGSIDLSGYNNNGTLYSNANIISTLNSKIGSRSMDFTGTGGFYTSPITLPTYTIAF